MIQQIWELSYTSIKILVFKCNWIESNTGVRTNKFRFKLVYLNRIGYKSDSFILGTQAKQIFNVEDPSDSQ